MQKKLQSQYIKLIALLFIGLSTSTTVGQIVISQVYNGISNNKCLEITNIGNDLDLASPIQYKIGLWANAGTTGNVSMSGNPSVFINLTGTLTQGQKCVISNSGSTATINNFNVLLISDNTITTFDGNDGLAIFTGTNTLVDAFGMGINYNAISYERQETVVTPKSNYNNAEWIAKTLAQFDAAGGLDNTILGLHYFDGSSITTTGTLASLNTIYGTPSDATAFVVASKSFRWIRDPMVPPGMTPMTVTIPLGFEACKLANFSGNVYAGGTTFEGDNGEGLSTTFYLRLAASTPPGNYSGSIFLSKQNVFEDVYVPTDPINTVNAKAITIVGLVANNKVNDETTQATLRGNATLTGVLSSDVSNVLLAGTPTANFNDALTANNKPVTVIGYTISGSKAGNYVLNQPTGLVANITDVVVPLVAQTISFNALANVAYGNLNVSLTASSNSGLTVSYTSSNLNAATVSGNVVTIVGAGTTTITAFQYGDSVYDVAPSVDQLFTVTPKQITAAAAVANKIYDRTAVAALTGTLTGVIGSDVVTLIGSGAFTNVNVGTGIAVTSTSTLGGATASNYTLTQPTGLTANITVKPITVTATAANKIYDRTTTATVTGALVGVLGADVVNFNGSGNFLTANAGTTPVSSTSTISGTHAANYSLTQPGGLTATITKKALTLTSPVAANKVFDGTSAATVAGTLSGIISPDVVTLVGTGTFASSAVGTGIAVTSTSTLSGASAANYSLTQPTGLTANITAAPTVFVVGDLSIIGFQFTTPNSFAFVTWVALNPNTYIKFTDNAFLSAGSANANNNARGGENFVIWRNNGAIIPAGTVITIKDNTSAAITSSGTIVSGNLNALSLSGDTIFAYQGAATSGGTPDWNANTNPTTFNGTILFGLYGQGTSLATSWITSGGASANNSYLPSQLNVTNGNIALAGLASKGQFTGSRSNQTSFNGYKALVANPSNWTTAAGAGTLTLNTTGFTIPPASTAAMISGTTSICTGNTINLKVTITGGTSPFKVVYTDGSILFTVNNYTSDANISVSPSNSATFSLVSVTDSNNLAGSGNSGTAVISVTARTTTGSVTQSQCGGTYTWSANNTTYSASTTQIVTTGCNTATLNLTITAATIEGSVTQSQCGGTYTWPANSVTYNSSTTQAVTVGCNTATLNLTIATPTTTGSESKNICGTSYTWPTNGVTYTSSGTYPFVSGCNIATLTLLLNTAAQIFYADNDGDSFGAGAVILSCAGQPANTSINNTDCNDTIAAVNPNASEIIGNSIDDNCDGMVDESASQTGLVNSQCGFTMTDINNTIFANQVADAMGYRFEVTNGSNVRTFDSATNGFSLLSLTGDVFYNTTYAIRVSFKTTPGFYRAYSTSCAVTTPAAPAATSLVAIQCGGTLTSIFTSLFANQVTAASQYGFEVVNGAEVRTCSSVTNRFSLINLSGINQYGTTYTVRVRLMIGGVWQDYGAACTVTTPATPATSSVSFPSCGSTISNSWQTIFATPIGDAQGYRFEVSWDGGASVRYYNSAVPRFSLRNLANFTTTPNTAYTLRIAILYADVYQAFGTSCVINTAGVVTRQAATDVSLFEVKAYPNPFASAFRLDVNTSSEANVEFKVYDMLGKLMEARELSLAEFGSLKIGDRYTSGVYNVIVTQGVNVKTVRVIKR